MTYTVKKGDSLWKIAKKTTGNGVNFKDLVAANPQLKDPNLIYPGQQLKMPDSWKSLKQEEGSVKVEVPKKELKTPKQITQKPTQVSSAKKTTSPAKSNNASKDWLVDLNGKPKETTMQEVVITGKKKMQLPVVKSSAQKTTTQEADSTITKTAKTALVKKPLPTKKPLAKVEKPSAKPTTKLLTNVSSSKQQSIWSKVVDAVKAAIPEKVYEFGDLISDKNMGIGDKLSIVYNGIVGAALKKFGIGESDFAKQDSSQLRPVEDKQKTLLTDSITRPGVIDASKIYETVQGDTIWDSDNARRFSLPGSFNLDDIQFGTRNRYENRNIQGTRGIKVPTMQGFRPYDQVQLSDNGGTYIGVNKDGKIQAGTLSDFSDGSMLSSAAHFKFAGSQRDSNGNLQWTADRGNKGAYMPMAYEELEDGTLRPRLVNLLNWRKANADSYGGTWRNTNGGAVLVSTPYEHRLIRGSANLIMSLLDDMYKNYKNVPLDVYIVDNGTFATGLTTSDDMLTEQDLRNYDRLNTAGGHGLYEIIPRERDLYSEYMFDRPLTMPGKNQSSFVFDESYEF